MNWCGDSSYSGADRIIVLAVRPDDTLPEDDADLIAGAEAAASWVRSRRATWTTAPLAPAMATARKSTPEFHVTAPPPPAAAASFPVTVPEQPRGPSFAARTAESLRDVAPAAGKWVARGVAATVVLGGAVVGGRYVLNAISTMRTRAPVVAPRAVVPPTGVKRKASGELRVNSTPAGAQVLVDGKARGVTPVALAELSPGRHELTLVSGAGTVRRDIRITAGETTVIEEAIFSGWVTVYSPFEVAIVENGRVLPVDARNQAMLPAGVHELTMTNKALGFETAARVEVKPGETANVRLTPEPSHVSVTATEPAEVWIDGSRVGDTPVSAATVALGTHEVLVKRAAGGERRFTITVGVTPFTLNVDF